MSAAVEQEAERFACYLIGMPPDRQVTEIYARALAGGPPIDARDAALLRFATRRRALGILDAGLALVEPDAELRRRLHLMFAILESNARYHDRFLPVDRKPLYALVVAAAGVRAVAKAVLGAVVVVLITR